MSADESLKNNYKHRTSHIDSSNIFAYLNDFQAIEDDLLTVESYPKISAALLQGTSDLIEILKTEKDNLTTQKVFYLSKFEKKRTKMKAKLRCFIDALGIDKEVDAEFGRIFTVLEETLNSYITENYTLNLEQLEKDFEIERSELNEFKAGDLKRKKEIVQKSMCVCSYNQLIEFKTEIKRKSKYDCDLIDRLFHEFKVLRKPEIMRLESKITEKFKLMVGEYGFVLLKKGEFDKQAELNRIKYEEILSEMESLKRNEKINDEMIFQLRTEIEELKKILAKLEISSTVVFKDKRLYNEMKKCKLDGLFEQEQSIGWITEGNKISILFKQKISIVEMGDVDFVDCSSLPFSRKNLDLSEVTFFSNFGRGLIFVTSADKMSSSLSLTYLLLWAELEGELKVVAHIFASYYPVRNKSICWLEERKSFITFGSSLFEFNLEKLQWTPLLSDSHTSQLRYPCILPSLEAKDVFFLVGGFDVLEESHLNNVAKERRVNNSYFKLMSKSQNTKKVPFDCCVSIIFNTWWQVEDGSFRAIGTKDEKTNWLVKIKENNGELLLTIEKELKFNWLVVGSARLKDEVVLFGVKGIVGVVSGNTVRRLDNR